MMNPTVKQRWLNALRSGEYKQGIDELKNEDNQFCCLGVLCDILKDDINGYWDELGNFCTVEEINKCILIEPVMLHSGLECCSPSVMINDSKLKLIYLNDTLKYNFNQIADLIEEQL